MVERGDEGPKCAALRSVLSEMVASETSEASKDIFDVEDSLEVSEIAESVCWTIAGGEVESGASCGFHHLELGTGVSSKSARLVLLLCWYSICFKVYTLDYTHPPTYHVH